MHIPIRLHRTNVPIFIHTIVAPTGVDARMERNIPDAAQTTDMTADVSITLQKLLNMRMAESAGKIISADMRREPTSFMARTMTDAVTTAISRLYLPAFIPVAWAKVSDRKSVV